MPVLVKIVLLVRVDVAVVRSFIVGVGVGVVEAMSPSQQ